MDILVSYSAFGGLLVKACWFIKTYIDNCSLSSGFPVIRLQDDLLQLEDILDVSHELDKVPLPPAFLLSLAILL